MKWPFRKYIHKGKRAHSQRQSHRANVHRELREDSGKRVDKKKERQ